MRFQSGARMHMMAYLNWWGVVCVGGDSQGAAQPTNRTHTLTHSISLIEHPLHHVHHMCGSIESYIYIWREKRGGGGGAKERTSVQ